MGYGITTDDSYGEMFDTSKHTSGTEIKAITYSNMQIHEKEDKVEFFVIVDIWWLPLATKPF